MVLRFELLVFLAFEQIGDFQDKTTKTVALKTHTHTHTLSLTHTHIQHTRVRSLTHTSARAHGKKD